MPFLPAQIPEIPEERSAVVPARLARKVGPLFGVSWDAGPFGPRTWVSDHSRITLSEIARGAPLPTRSRSADLTVTDGWDVVERVGVSPRGTPLPNEIANATLNRFGPDTRAAVLLTAANVLLEPVRAAVDAALGLLRDAAGEPLPPELRLVAWGTLMVETFRSQPALVLAAIGARAVQRELTTTWDLPLAERLTGLPLTRCEIGSPDRAASPSQPTDLAVVDATFAALDLEAPGAPALSRRLRHDEVVDRVLRRLRAAGTLQDASHLWLSERRPGELVVEALVPPTQLVHDLVGQIIGPASTGPVLPCIPAVDAVAHLAPLARRAVLIALLGVLRHIQFDAVRREHTRDEVVTAVAALGPLAALLPADDPLRPVVRCRIALMTVQTLRFDRGTALAAPLAELLAATDACAAALDADVLDRGAAAEIMGAANIEVNAVRMTNATDHAAGLPAPEALDAWLRVSWERHLRALEIHPAAVNSVAAAPGLLGFHLHNYAAFLAGHDDEDDLLASVRLFRDCVLPARALFHERSGIFDPLRHSLQVATRATSTLAEQAVARGADAVARKWATQGSDWARSALDHPSSATLLAEATEPACRMALLAARALLVGHEVGAVGFATADLTEIAELLKIARRWERSAVGDDQDAHVRHGEIVDLEQRLEKRRTTP